MKSFTFLLFVYFSHIYANTTGSGTQNVQTGDQTETRTAAGAGGVTTVSGEGATFKLDLLARQPTGAGAGAAVGAGTWTESTDGNLKLWKFVLDPGKHVGEVVLGDKLLWQPKEGEKLVGCTVHLYNTDFLLTRLGVHDRSLVTETAETVVTAGGEGSGTAVSQPASTSGSGVSGQQQTQVAQPTTVVPTANKFYAYRTTSGGVVRLYDDDYEDTLRRFKERAGKANATLETVAHVTEHVRVHDGITLPTMYIAIFAIVLFTLKI